MAFVAASILRPETTLTEDIASQCEANHAVSVSSERGIEINR